MSKRPRPLPGSWVDTWKFEPKQRLATGARAVLFALANYMDRDGVAWPSLSTLQRDTGMCRRSVTRSLDQAEEAGWILREQGGGPPGRGGRPTLYRCTTPGESRSMASPLVESGDMTPPLSQSRDRDDRSRDRAVVEVGTETHPERPVGNVKRRTSSRYLSDEDIRRIRHEVPLVLDADDPDRLVGIGIKGLNRAEALWVFEGRALLREEFDRDGLGAADVDELLTRVLCDLVRKHGRFTRKSFLSFAEADVKIHHPEGDQLELALRVQEAWPSDPWTPAPWDDWR